MLCTALSAGILQKKENLFEYIIKAIQQKNTVLEEYSVLVISSKVVAISQGRTSSLPIREAVAKEADEILADHGAFFLTVKNGIVIANAGIDLSNSQTGECILWPEDPKLVCEDLRKKIQDQYAIENIGIIISDSRVTPRRQGTVGVALAWSGIHGIKDERGTKDLFGRTLLFSNANIVDNLTSASEILMGQAAECIPLVLISQLDPIHFTNEEQFPTIALISKEEDLFEI